jgi:hypothetical protein
MTHKRWLWNSASKAGVCRTPFVTALTILLLSFFCGQSASAQSLQKKTPPKQAAPKPLIRAKAKATSPETRTQGSQKRLEKDNPELVQKRMEWFYKQRAFPFSNIPAGARMNAFTHMQRMMENEGKLVRNPDGTFAPALANVTLPPPPTWSAIGPAPTSGGFFSPVTGRVTTIAVDPSDATGNTVLIGGAQGGIWRSTDGGATWTAVGDANPSLAMGAIAFAPSALATVYAGTGEQALTGFDVYYGAGILKSTDSGQHWALTCTPSISCPFTGPFSNGFFPGGGARISYLSVNPANPSLVLAGVQVFTGTNTAGVYCSSDGGSTWTNIIAGQMATFVAFATNSIAYAALGRGFGSSVNGTNPNGVYKLTNATNCSPTISNISPTSLIPGGSSIGRIDIGIDPNDATGNTLYASIANASTTSELNIGVFKTVNGGTSWTNTNAPDICQFQCWYDNVVKVDPANASFIFFGGGAVFLGNSFAWVMRSSNGGAAWSPAIPTSPNGGDPTLPHVDVHAITLFRATSGTNSGKTIAYLGNDGGLWRTNDAEAATVSWTNINNSPLQLTQFYPSLSVHPSNPNIAFAGSQDNASQNFGDPSATSFLNWVDNQTCGDGGWTAIDPQTPSTVYVVCIFADINKSLFNGAPRSFKPAINGVNQTDPVNFIPPITIDAVNPQRLYFGTNRIWQSTDGANSWNAISNPISSGFGVITALAVGGSTGSVVYAGTDDAQVAVATNVSPGPATFNLVTGIGTQLPNRAVTQIVTDPGDGTGKTAYVLYSGFSGLYPATGLTGDHLGHIFKTIDAGAVWTDMSCTKVGACETPNASDLPNIPVNDLVIDPDVSGTLFAATDLGVFQGTCTVTCSWTTFNNSSLPAVAVFSLRLHEPSRTMMAATHGRGAWSVVLNNFTQTFNISELKPASAPPGTTSLPLTIVGNGFTGSVSSAINWTINGVITHPTLTFVNANQLTTNLGSAQLQNAGDAIVTVTDTPGTTNALTFTVLGAPPTLTSINPTQVPVGSGNTAMMLTGSGFVSGSQVFFNGAANGVSTTFNSSTSLSAMIPSSLLGPFGSTNDITVVNPPPGGGPSLPQTFKVVAPPPVNDNFASAININLTNGAFTDTKDSSGATTEAADPVPACVLQFSVAQGNTGGHPNGDYNTIWYKFTPASNGNVSIDTNGSNYDTALSVWTGSAGSLAAVPNGCNDDINPGIVLTSQVAFNVTNGTTYFIMVSSFGPPDPNPLALGGKSVINVSFAQAPFAFTSQPTTNTVNAGSSATYTITVNAVMSGFNSPVTVSCSVQSPAPTSFPPTCSLNPTTITPGGAPSSSTLTVSTTSRAFVPPAPFAWRWPRFMPVPILAALVLLFAALIYFSRSKRQRSFVGATFALVVLFLVFEAAGCGGGSSPPAPHGTPPGTYTITVTGASGGQTNTTNVTLNVN